MYPDDWRSRIINAVLGLACMAAILLLLPAVVNRFWSLMLALVVAILVGNLLGPVVDRRLFQPSSGDQPNHPPRA
jgi:predicted PurR-regulated permease PerM